MTSGQLPPSWFDQTLRDIAAVNYGRDPSPILEDDGRYPVYGTSGKDRKGNDFLYDGDSVVLGRKGSIDRVRFAEGRFWTIDTAYYLSDFEKALPKWLYYYLCTIDLRALNEATGVPSLSRDVLYKLRVPTPPEPEQIKIAEVLSTIDSAIDETKTIIVKHQRIKTGLMQDLLACGIDEHGTLRSEETHEFTDSPVGRVPAAWTCPSIGDLADHVKSGVTPRGGQSVYTPDGVLFLRSQNIHFGELRLEDVAYIPERIHRAMLRSQVFENDVLLNITGASIGRCCRMPATSREANVNQHVCAIRLKEVSRPRASFLSAVLESHIGQRQIARLNAGGNREGLNYQQVRAFVVPWPSDPDEFTRITDAINSVVATIDAFSEAVDKLRLLRTGLMQDLLSGDRRVTALLDQREAVTA